MPADILSATIDRFEGDKAVLRFEDGQELVLERSSLPAQTHEGTQLFLELKSSNLESNKQIEAKHLLMEILQGK
jgi:hypothetical protein